MQERVDAREPRAHVAERRAHLDAGTAASTSTISGSTENVTREQLDVQVASITITMPISVNDVAEQRDDAGGEQLVEHVDVAGHARHQPADRVAVEERDRQPLEMREQLRAAGRSMMSLPDALHDLGLEVAEPEARSRARQR